MDKVVSFEIRDRVFVYLDDLLIVSSDFKTHIEEVIQSWSHIKYAVVDFSTLTAPITDTLKLSSKFQFRPEALIAFEQLKCRQ